MPTPIVGAAATLPPSPTAMPTEPTVTPTPTAASELPSAREVLESATAAMSALKSGHAHIDITVKVDVPGEQPDHSFAMIVSVDFQVPDRQRGTVSSSLGSGGFSIQQEVIYVGSKAYLKDRESDEWSSTPERPEPYGDLFSFGAFNTSFADDVADNFELVGREALDEEPVYHLKGHVVGESLSDLIGYPAGANDEGEVAFWVGVEDFLVRKAVMQFELADSDVGVTSEVQSVMTLSDFNKPVDIQAPEVKATQTAPVVEVKAPKPAPEEDKGVITEVLDNGWTRANLPELDFAIAAPPSWEFSGGYEGTNLRSEVWLIAREPQGEAGQEVRSEFTLQVDDLYSIYNNLDEYVEVTRANTAFFADIADEDIAVEEVELPVADAVRLTFASISPSVGVELYQEMYILVRDESAFLVGFKTASDRMDEMAPLFGEIAATIELD